MSRRRACWGDAELPHAPRFALALTQRLPPPVLMAFPLVVLEHRLIPAGTVTIPSATFSCRVFGWASTGRRKPQIPKIY